MFPPQRLTQPLSSPVAGDDRPAPCADAVSRHAQRRGCDHRGARGSAKISDRRGFCTGNFSRTWLDSWGGRHVRPRLPFLPRNADLVFREFFLDPVEDPDDGATAAAGARRQFGVQASRIEPIAVPAVRAPAPATYPTDTSASFLLRSTGPDPAESAAPHPRTSTESFPECEAWNATDVLDLTQIRGQVRFPDESGAAGHVKSLSRTTSGENTSE